MEKDYKNTLLMPQTDFEMRANLVEKEKKFRQRWTEQDIYQKALKANKENGKGSFVLHDGPPYANGNIHVGHALNKILKDIIVRQKTMEGFYSPFVPGWDTHGLPIENKMLKELNMTKDSMSPIDLRKAAQKYALSQVAQQEEQFKELQLLTDFSQKYITLSKEYEVGQLELFKKLALSGLIYKGLKPIYWSPSSQTALADAEVEYEDVVSPSVIVAFELNSENSILKQGDNLLIMTTTPWTLLANSGVAVGNDIDYVLVEANGQRYVVANALLESVAKLAKWEEFTKVADFNANDLVGLTYKTPFHDREGKVVDGHHVSVEAGTGLVHMAPLFGEDDYLIGKKHKLDMIMHVDSKGYLNDEAKEFKGKFYMDANKDVGMELDKKGKLLSLKFIKHSYPHDWRTHKPVIYRGVPQWFFNIEEIKKDILGALEGVTSTPDWGIKRIFNMIESRNEWTISRQRTWGFPLVIFYDENQKPVFEEDIFNYVIELVKENGTDVWWEKSTDELLPEKYRGKNFTREMDIMDVWFDSGSSSVAVDIDGVKPPYDLYFEGSDQYRGWFNSSLINSVAYRGVSPYKKLISHGMVLDGKKQKMSKSKGNVIDPLTIVNKNGADILRLWVANTEYTSDVSISDEILKQNIEIYRRIRNTFKFMLGNLFDFDYSKDSVELKGIHKLISSQVFEYQEKVSKNFAEYKFQEIVKDTNKFLIDLSSWYFSYAKDSLYCDKADSSERRMIQTNIFNILETVLRAVAPIIPTTAEEVYDNFNKKYKAESLFLDAKGNELQTVNADEASINLYTKYREKANQAIEVAIKEGTIKRSNEALLTIDIPEEDRIFSNEQFAKYLMVAYVEFGTEFKVSSFESTKCKRCWNHFKLDEIKEDICNRCENVVQDLN